MADETNKNTSFQPLTFSEQVEAAKMLAQSNLIDESYQGNPANCLEAIGLGQQVGIGPAESLLEIDVVHGKPTMSALLIEGLVRRAGHKIVVNKDEQKQSVTVTIVRRDHPDVTYTSTRDKAWAEQMGLTGSGRNGSPSNYKRQLMTMLTWRAITDCARVACADALGGIAYTPDEMHDLDSKPSQATQHTIPRDTPHRLAAAAQITRDTKPSTRADETTEPAQTKPIQQAPEDTADDETPRENAQSTVESKAASPEAVRELGHPAPKIQQGMITPRQISVINQILRSVGCTSAEKAKAFINGFTPHKIEHISDLTEAEAEETINKIKKGETK